MHVHDSDRQRPPRSWSVLPTIVRATLLMHRAYLVGSAAEWFLDETKPAPKDWDLIIAPEHFHEACKILTDVKVRINSFGGVKTLDPAVDFMCMDLGEYVRRCCGHIAISAQPYKIVRW